LKKAIEVGYGNDGMAGGCYQSGFQISMVQKDFLNHFAG
jgi:hypothetical protein